MSLSLYNYQSKSSRYRQGYLKTRATTNQKHKIDSPKPKRREHKHKMKGNHHSTKKEKKKKKEEQQRNNQLWKKGLKWQQIYICVSIYVSRAYNILPTRYHLRAKGTYRLKRWCWKIFHANINDKRPEWKYSNQTT